MKIEYKINHRNVKISLIFYSIYKKPCNNIITAQINIDFIRINLIYLRIVSINAQIYALYHMKAVEPWSTQGIIFHLL